MRSGQANVPTAKNISSSGDVGFSGECKHVATFRLLSGDHSSSRATSGHVLDGQSLTTPGALRPAPSDNDSSGTVPSGGVHHPSGVEGYDVGPEFGHQRERHCSLRQGPAGTMVQHLLGGDRVTRESSPCAASQQGRVKASRYRLTGHWYADTTLAYSLSLLRL